MYINMLSIPSIVAAGACAATRTSCSSPSRPSRSAARQSCGISLSSVESRQSTSRSIAEPAGMRGGGEGRERGSRFSSPWVGQRGGGCVRWVCDALDRGAGLVEDARRARRGHAMGCSVARCYLPTRPLTCISMFLVKRRVGE